MYVCVAEEGFIKSDRGVRDLMLIICLNKLQYPPKLKSPAFLFISKEISRVVGSWDRMLQGKVFEDKATQRFAESYVEGLEAKPWYEVARYERKMD